MTRTFRTGAIVLKKHKYGEADNVLSLLSADGARTGAIAKGVRRTKSKFGGRLEPFSHIDVMLHRGKGSLLTVTQAETVESFEDVRGDYDKLSHGSAVLDLLDRVCVEDHGDERVFGLTLATLRALATAGGGYRRTLSAFEVKLMSIIGYRPHAGCCVVCGCAVRDGYFSNRAGGVMCPGCAVTDETSMPIDAATQAYLTELLGARMVGLDEIEATPRCEEGLADLLRGFVAYHIQSRLKSREFLARQGGF